MPASCFHTFSPMIRHFSYAAISADYVCWLRHTLYGLSLILPRYATPLMLFDIRLPHTARHYYHVWCYYCHGVFRAGYFFICLTVIIIISPLSSFDTYFHHYFAIFIIIDADTTFHWLWFSPITPFISLLRHDIYTPHWPLLFSLSRHFSLSCFFHLLRFHYYHYFFSCHFIDGAFDISLLLLAIWAAAVITVMLFHDISRYFITAILPMLPLLCHYYIFAEYLLLSTIDTPRYFSSYYYAAVSIADMDIRRLIIDYFRRYSITAD